MELCRRGGTLPSSKQLRRTSTRRQRTTESRRQSFRDESTSCGISSQCRRRLLARAAAFLVAPTTAHGAPRACQAPSSLTPPPLLQARCRRCAAWTFIAPRCRGVSQTKGCKGPRTQTERMQQHEQQSESRASPQGQKRKLEPEDPPNDENNGEGSGGGPAGGSSETKQRKAVRERARRENLNALYVSHSQDEMCGSYCSAPGVPGGLLCSVC